MVDQDGRHVQGGLTGLGLEAVDDGVAVLLQVAVDLLDGADL